MTDFDAWLTSDPDDRPYCATHLREIPCWQCRVEHFEARTEARLEEKRGGAAT